MRLERMVRLKPDDGFTYVRIAKKDTGLPCDVLLNSLGIERFSKKHPKPPYLLMEYKKGIYIPILIGHPTLPSLPVRICRDYFGGFISASVAEVDCWAIINAEPLLKHYFQVIDDIEVYQEVTEPGQTEKFIQMIKNSKKGFWPCPAQN